MPLHKAEKVTPGYHWARPDVYILWRRWKCFLQTSLPQIADFHNWPAGIIQWFLGNLDSRSVIWSRMGQTFKCAHKLSFVLNRSCWMLNRSWKNLADSTCLIQNHLQWCIYWFHHLSFYLLKIHLQQGKKKSNFWINIRRLNQRKQKKHTKEARGRRRCPKPYFLIISVLVNGGHSLWWYKPMQLHQF